MKTIDLRFCLIASVIVLVLGGGLHLLHGFQIQRHAGFFLDQADAALEEEDVGEAIAALERYLDLRPRDADAVARLGTVLADASRHRRAFVTLEKALRLDPTRDEVRRRLVEVALRLRRHRDAEEHLQTHLLPSAPDDPELLRFLGLCQVAEQEYLRAAETFRRAIEADPHGVDHYLHLTLLLREHPDAFADEARWQSESADTWMDRLVEVNEDSARAHLARGHYRYSVGRFEEALADTDRSLAIEPEAPRALLLSAECLAELKRYDEARDRGRRALQQAPGMAAAYATLADIELEQNRTDAAIEWLFQGAEAVEARSTIPVRLVRLLLASDRLDEAEKIVARLGEDGYPAPITGLLEARLAFHREQWRDAQTRLLAVRPQVAQAADLLKEVEYLLGRTCERLGDFEGAISAYRKSVGADRSYAAPRAALVDLLGRLGRLDEAAEQQQALGGILGGTVAPAQRARLLLARNLSLPEDQRDWTQLEGLLRQMDESEGQALAATLFRAEVLLAQNRADEAEKLLLAARQQHPDKISVWTTLSRLAGRRGDWDQARRWLDEATASAGDSVDLRLAKASLVARSPQPASERGARLLELADDAPSSDPESKRILWRGLIQAALQADETGTADAIARRALDELPNDLALCELAFKVAGQLGDEQLLGARLDRIHAIEGPGPLWHFSKATWLVDRAVQAESNDFAEAQRLLDVAARQRPQWAAVPLLQARIHDLLGDSASATDCYLRAIDLGTTDTPAIRRAVELLHGQQRYAEAGELLSACQAREQPLGEDFDRLRSQVLGRLALLEEALQPARRAAADSEDPRDHLWLGSLLMSLGFKHQAAGRDGQAAPLLAEAETSLRRARELDLAAPGPWVATIELLSRSGRRHDAEKLLPGLETNVPPTIAPRAMAAAHLALGQVEAAEAQYRKALQATPDDVSLIRSVAYFCARTGRPQLALDRLREVVAGAVEATAEDRKWCRRTLALSLAEWGRFAELQEALDLVQQNLDDDPASVADRQAKAALLAKHPQQRKRNEGAAILEELVATSNVGDEARWMLARLHASEGRWERAVPHLRVLSRPDALRMYLGHLIRSGALDEAELRLRQLERIAPADIATLAAAADLEFERGHFDAALDLVRKRHAEEGVSDQTLALVQLLDARAAKLEASDSRLLAERFRAEAESLLDDYLQKHPDRPLAGVAMLARWGRHEEALAVLEEAIPTAESRQLARAVIALCPLLASQPKDLERLQSLSREAIARHGRGTEWLLAQIRVSEAGERFDRLVKLYGELLEQQPDNVAVLNNLAELLALRGERLDRALDLVNHAIELDGPRASLLDTRASVYRALGQPADAIRDMELVVADAPKPNRLVHLAMAYVQAKQTEKARQAVAKASAEAARSAADGDPEPVVLSQLHPLERAACRDLLSRLR